MKTWILLASACIGLSGTAEAKLIDGVRAVVQDRPILISDISTLVQAIKKSPTLANIMGINPTGFNEDAALNLLIEDRVVLSAAKEIGAEPTEADISKQIASIAGQNGMSVDALKRSLAAEKIDFEHYRENIEVQLAKRAIMEREIRSANAGQSDQELKNYYEQNAPPELLLSMIKSGSGKAATAKLAKLKNTLQASISEKTLRQAGAVDLGWNEIDGLNDAFQSALTKMGSSQISNVFAWKGSTYLLVVRERRKGSTGNFEAVKDQLRARVQAKDSEERFKAWIEQKKRQLNIVVNKT